MTKIAGSHDLLFLVLDTLRHDVAVQEFESGRTPNFRELIPDGWEERHTPGSFTFAALQSFFAGFLPTPATPGGNRQPRLFAARFAGSETASRGTLTFDEENIVAGLRSTGYLTICVGGVGFFNGETALSRVFPRMFCESHWRAEFGVASPSSTECQFAHAAGVVESKPRAQPVFLFVNVSAIHQPNYFYCRASGPDDLESHAAALRYVDSQLPVLMRGFSRRGRPLFAIVCSDHGTAYGEDGHAGHRLAHSTVWTVPYAEAIIRPSAPPA